MASPSQKICPCGSQLLLQDCCLPFIQGKKQPEIAEQLLRARYTAFVLHEVDYILETVHSRMKAETQRDEIEDWSKNSEWESLTVYKSEGGSKTDTKGTLVFCAKYKKDGKPEEHWEQSTFEKEGGVWKFYDAQGVHVGTYRREAPKVGRNDPCSCGSGKKFKKCHG